MKGYTSETIRNVAVVGHSGCGKTTFLESVLLETGAITRMGKVEDGNTVSDYDKMEVEKGYSINYIGGSCGMEGEQDQFHRHTGIF